MTAMAAFLLVGAFNGPAAAQCYLFNCQQADPDGGSASQSSNSALMDIGNQYLQRLGAQMSSKTAGGSGNNPGGGGAEDMQQRYRAWLEGYGSVSRAGAQGTFTGDRRTTYGGIAGFGATIAQGVAVGVSVDRSHTKADVSNLPQSGRIDVTQVGLNGAIEHGRWALGLAVIHGIGTVRTSRFDAGGENTAAYDARLWGALAELSYFVPLPNNSRLVPKFGFDWMQVRSDPFVESGGLGPVSGSALTSTRVRMLAGAEVGHSWLVGRTVFDIAAYGRLVNNLVQNMGDLQVSLASGAGTPVSLAGVRESTLGADAGVTFTAGITEAARLYAIYDGRFRSNSDSHSGTLGVEVRW